MAIFDSHFKLYSIMLVLVALSSCAPQEQYPAPQQHSSNRRLADLQIVDCLLPGQIRRIGGMSYLTPRRPTNTTASDCRVRGGEYVEFDRANYKTALTVWMTDAENGDANAQTNVGEIFERGLGGSPNFEAAAIWYRRAAEQGNSRAQFNLGTLYEQGHGVEKDNLKALNWYRKAWGLPEDDLIFQSAAYKAQQALKEQMQQELEERNAQIELLNKQIERLKEKAGNSQDSSRLEDELKQLKAWLGKIEEEKNITQDQYAALPIFREPKSVQTSRQHKAKKSNLNEGINYGKYYALVIGNQDYKNIEKLRSPRRDAQEISQLLEKKYGFSVQTLLDASNITVMQAINDLNNIVNEDDNLLIYYAGHGNRVFSGEFEYGYWLPVNADPPPTDTFWVSNEFVTRHLSRLRAKRILVIADSCYAGLLSNAPGYLFMGDDKKYTEEYIRYKLAKKSRLLLTSGGDEPVLDNAGGGHSVFAGALLEELEANNNVLASPELYIKIRDRVSKGARAVGFDQEPEFKAIKGAGHEVGDFFFVPVTNF